MYSHLVLRVMHEFLVRRLAFVLFDGSLGSNPNSIEGLVHGRAV